MALLPQNPGEKVIHVGAGTGYYTTLLAMLVLPNGHVQAFEIDRCLADRARENLEPFEGIAVTNDDATALPMQSASLGYVSASVVALPAHRLEALLPGGRIILPWQANKRTGLPS